ncbi:M23 family metallopeptidase [Streptomyces sp. MAR4 CNX-425]|uniref:M23 family metallopeptidase n=1 Tax=Streptomyces sp. MAR4 CNX-425 TaxID=3406343 RepID=UPI003B51419E
MPRTSPRTRRTAAVVLAAVLAALAGAGAAGAAPAAPAATTAQVSPVAPAEPPPPAHGGQHARHAAAGTTPAAPAPRTYRVRPGDTLTAIARRLGVPVRLLYANNRTVIGDDPDVLRPGQVLLAPAPGWAAPVTADYRISARYGIPGDSWAAGYHTGVDLAVPTGTPVHSVGPGKVHSTSAEGAYGNHVLVRMADGRYVLYAHLDRMSVAAGDRVRGGTPIGDSGSTGNSSGPHLHLEVRTGTEYGTDIDPVAYLRGYGIRL